MAESLRKRQKRIVASGKNRRGLPFKSLTRGRKPLSLPSYKQIELIVASVIDCPMSELATQLRISIGTLKNRINDDPELETAIERGRQRGRYELRKRQYDIAKSDERGAGAMAIWLGKQYLAQAESVARHDIRTVVVENAEVAALEAHLDRLIASLPESIEARRIAAESSSGADAGDVELEPVREGQPASAAR